MVLRFFEHRTNAEAAAMLGVGEWAARKRAERALDRLRDYFERCGIPSTAAALSDTIAANGTLAAPASLAGAVTLAALAQGAAASASSTPLIH
ncbi:MAG TPA: sigma factor-like helix-turn-helix DNA-binding protein, partial [Verrucomicrobiae bacterium]|nr:sigma factor-like helix-turn-helix DNA-binding protein [Verrucomicrobiae bacterium]